MSENLTKGTLDGYILTFTSDMGQRIDAMMNAWPVLQVGKTSTGKLVPFTLDSSGNISAVLAAGSAAIGGTKDNGPHWTPVRTHTASADMTTAAAITAAPTSGQKIVADDILVSTDTAMSFTIEMETTGNDLAKVFIPANGTVQITLRDGLKGDAADKKLYGKASVAGNVAITACYHSET